MTLLQYCWCAQECNWDSCSCAQGCRIGSGTGCTSWASQTWSVVFGRSMSLQEAGQWGALAALVAGLLGLAASVQAAQERVCGPDLLSPCPLLVSRRCTRLRWHPLCTKAERPCMLLRVFQANRALRRFLI